MTSYSARVLYSDFPCVYQHHDMGDLNNTGKAVYKAIDVKIVLCMLLC